MEQKPAAAEAVGHHQSRERSAAACMAAPSGAPPGNHNALKHGAFTKESIELHATLRKEIREAQKLLKELSG